MLVVFLVYVTTSIKVVSSSRGQKGVTEWVTPKSEHEEWVGIFQKAKGSKRAACARALRCSEKDHKNRDEPGYEDMCRQGRKFRFYLESEWYLVY